MDRSFRRYRAHMVHHFVQVSGGTEDGFLTHPCGGRSASLDANRDRRRMPLPDREHAIQCPQVGMQGAAQPYQGLRAKRLTSTVGRFSSPPLNKGPTMSARRGPAFTSTPRLLKAAVSSGVGACGRFFSKSHCTMWASGASRTTSLLPETRKTRCSPSFSAQPSTVASMPRSVAPTRRFTMCCDTTSTFSHRPARVRSSHVWVSWVARSLTDSTPSRRSRPSRTSSHHSAKPYGQLVLIPRVRERTSARVVAAGQAVISTAAQASPAREPLICSLP
jgi:hypothetical protein